MTDKSLLTVGAMLLAGATILTELPASNEADISACPTTTPAAHTQAAAPVPAPISQANAPDIAMPASSTSALPSDTQVDGALRQDAEGKLVIDPALHDYLDYFIGRIDLIGRKAALAALAKDTHGRLQAPAMQEFFALLEHYATYKQALIALLDQPLSASQQHDAAAQLALMRQTHEQVMQLRRQYLGEMVTRAFFADEESYAQYTLRGMELAGNRDISEAAREQALQELDQLIQPAILASHQHEQALALATTHQRGSTDSTTHP
ncbi:lipase secretion chaperone [Aquipseudomonas ullengensis]|uniref:Lipase chaperone n=1 Tax=Aquipseudomonas ullengensis TaxID=2759166 RepID=A0A7W4LID0_9GAMM|nr:lipase secretion chaperone [Pseudomonas ullengensis]MBB2493633.1 hypothetical protein [Pseudomonas ullengensis]